MQTILGAGGVIATEVAKALPRYTDKIRLVSRHPEKVNPTDGLMIGDMMNPQDAEKAIKGSDVTYLTIGLKYSTRIWESSWPRIMENVIQACLKYNSKLVFFDNVYMYGKVNGWMTEQTPYNPCSKKGMVREKIANMLMDAVEKKNLTALIARSADFYGYTPLSFISMMVFVKMVQGKKPQLLLNDNTRHSFTYIPDAGKATAFLGNKDDAYNRTWHLPTDHNVITGKEIVEKLAEILKTKATYSVLNKWMLRMASWFDPIVKETIEMLYQNEKDYLFDSSDIFKTYGLEATPFAIGLKQTIDLYRKEVNNAI